jgi:hypothetical protein
MPSMVCSTFPKIDLLIDRLILSNCYYLMYRLCLSIANLIQTESGQTPEGAVQLLSQTCNKLVDVSR